MMSFSRISVSLQNKDKIIKVYVFVRDYKYVDFMYNRGFL